MDLKNYTHFPHVFFGKKCRRLLGRAAAFVLSATLAAAPVTALAESDYKILLTPDGLEDYYGEIAANKKQPIQTNQVPNWPEGPKVGAAGAVVMDADSGAVLYGKNQDMRLYPASITKVMTALLAYENLSPSDTITFSENAVFSIESGSSNIGMDVGQSITVDEALYGLMVASANEVAIALGERVSGSEEGFINLMNQRAAELGCVNTHFVTANGLHDKDHYSCAYDMALIAREAWKHPELIEYMSRPNYEFKATATQPDEFWLGNTNDFLNGAITCEDVVGGKTGYTDQARETLVTFATRGDMHLICVIMREEPPNQYYDTIELLDYAFENFKSVKVADKEDSFTLQSEKFLTMGQDVYGSSSPYYSISDNASVMIPEKASFRDLTQTVIPLSVSPVSPDENAGESSTSAPASDQDEDEKSPDSPQENGKKILGMIEYRYNDHIVGTANILFTPVETSYPEEVHGIRRLAFSLLHTGAHGSLYLNILLLIPLVLAAAFILCLIFFVQSYFAEMNRRRRLSTRRARQAQKNQEQDPGGYDDGYEDYDEYDALPSRTARSRQAGRQVRQVGRNRNRSQIRQTGRTRQTGQTGQTGRTRQTGQTGQTGRTRQTDSDRQPGGTAGTSGTGSRTRQNRTGSRRNSGAGTGPSDSSERRRRR